MTTPLPLPRAKAIHRHFWFWVFSLGWLVSMKAAPAESDSISPEYLAILRRGDIGQLREILARGASPNARDTAGNTPLMYAAIYGDASCLRLLIDQGGEVNAANEAGATVLMRAAFDYEKVRLLIEHGADVNARSSLGNTALILAARPPNSHRAVALLLSRGADAKTTNQFGATALMAAAAGGDEKSLRLFIKHGADVNAQPTPDQMGFLLGGGRSALMWAAYRGDVAMLKILLDAGADVNAVGVFGTALAQSAWSGRTAAARVLIERGARLDQVGPTDGYTPLHWAASTDASDPALVKLLLDHGADPNFGGGEPVDAFLGVLQTPLMLARRRGETPILTMLLNAGATNAAADRMPSRTPPLRYLSE
jgi:ankyrin repeat protein